MSAGTAGIGLWTGLSLASKRLIVAGATVLLAIVVVVGLALWNLRIVALEDARQNDGKLGMAIAEQTTRSIQAVDLILPQLRAQITQQADPSAAGLGTAVQSQAIQQELSRLQHSLPQSAAFAIIDARGQLVNFSRRWPAPHADLSDRGYFQYLRDHDDPDAVVTLVMRNRVTGTWTFYVVRRLDGRQGRFLGLVLGGVDLTYFRDFYQALTAGDDLGIALLDRDGCIAASVPSRRPSRDQASRRQRHVA